MTLLLYYILLYSSNYHTLYPLAPIYATNNRRIAYSTIYVLSLMQ